MLSFFYEGLYIFVRIDQFHFWLKHLPLMRDLHWVFSYLLPASETLLAILIIWPKTRRLALTLATVGCLSTLIYLILTLLYSGKFFLPFHPYWAFMKWFHKMLILLVIIWTLFYLLNFRIGKVQQQGENRNLQRKYDPDIYNGRLQP